MSQTSNLPVTLRVHFGGAIAYVPQGDTLWALMPNALAPTAARWSAMEGILTARSTHIPFLIVDEDLIDWGKTTSTNGIVDVLLQRGNHTDVGVGRSGVRSIVQNFNAKTYPPVKAAIALFGEQLDFGVPGNNVLIDPKVLSDVPQMSAIAPKHQYVSRRFLPGSQGFDRHGLRAAVHLNIGRLEVSGYFGRPNPEKVDFGYVYSVFGSPKYWSRVWGKEVANRLTWTINLDLPSHQTTVPIKNIDWEPNTNPTYYILKIPQNRTIDLEIMHAEVEVPALFLDDPKLPDGVEYFPDPDFEMFYGISSQTKKWLPWRVPVPTGSPAGSQEKPCAGGYFKGFA